jgi:uncharacterized protein YbjT (DUF2867 family)
MVDEKRILVTGATGAQGGGVVRHLLKGGKFKVRCLTRKPESERARALVQAGAETVRGDLGNPESLQAAMKGCYGVFGVTNFWEYFAKEAFHGKNLIDAVKQAEIEHFVFSTLPSAQKLSEGKFEVPHFDLKARMEEYARSLNLPPHTPRWPFITRTSSPSFHPNCRKTGLTCSDSRRAKRHWLRSA